MSPGVSEEEVCALATAYQQFLAFGPTLLGQGIKQLAQEVWSLA